MIWARPAAFVNARVVTRDGLAGSIRFSSRILALDDPPRAGDTVVDLQGAFVLPGLLNAHEHLELNHYGRLKGRDTYRNAVEWIDDLRPRLSADAAIRSGSAHPLGDRLFIGALKNLLAGVTTVAHHNPFYPELRRTIPIRIVRRYGWAHSFALERRPAGARGEPGGEIGPRWNATPADAPFIVHLAEGTDADARGELPRLEALGCLKPNTVIVHGVAIDANGWRRVARAGAGLVWCPASNAFLFGQTATVRDLLDLNGSRPRVALGTDSRVTGARDLLDEMRCALETGEAAPADLYGMVTHGPAGLLRLSRAGQLFVGGPADLVVLPQPPGSTAEDAHASLDHRAGRTLLAAARRDVRLVVLDGRPIVGDADFAPVFEARRVLNRRLVVDGAGKLADAGLVRRIDACPIAEPGVAAG